MNTLKEKKMKTIKNSKGFTLIELIIVIVILGILAAVALPKFANLSEDAKISAAKGMAGAIAAGVKIFHGKCLIEDAKGKDVRGDNETKSGNDPIKLEGDDFYANSECNPVSDQANTTLNSTECKDILPIFGLKGNDFKQITSDNTSSCTYTTKYTLDNNTTAKIYYDAKDGSVELKFE